MLLNKEVVMGYFSKSLYHSANKKHAEYGTVDSTSSEKGTDNKKNNTSEYNHEYYMRNKSKWSDNKDSDSSDDSNSSSDSEKEFDVDAAAWDVIRGKYKNGEERKKLLGEDYVMVQKRVNELMKSSSAAKNVSEQTSEQKAEEKKETRSFDEAKADYNKKKKETAQSAAKAANEKGKKQTEYYKKKTIKHYDNIGSVLIRDLDLY